MQECGQHSQKYILATDLDGTLIGCKKSLQQLNQVITKPRATFILVYITGRTFTSALQLLKSESLLIPDLLISDVGTEIHVAPNFIRNAGWETKIGYSWRINEMRSLLSQIKELQPQSINPKFRLSYTTERIDFDKALMKLNRLKYDFKLAIEIIPSLGHIIDILPEGAGKGPALRFIQEMYSISSCRVFVCGDSGNDYSMFTQGFQGIIVGNACSDFKQEVKSIYSCTHFSKGKYAAGILEGLEVYGFLDILEKV